MLTWLDCADRVNKLGYGRARQDLKHWTRCSCDKERGEATTFRFRIENWVCNFSHYSGRLDWLLLSFSCF